MLNFLLGLFAAVNVIAFLVMGLDKLAAIRDVRRFRESTLIAFTACGGFIGVLAGSTLFRHKTLKQPFRTWMFLALLPNILWFWIASRMV